MNKSLVLASLVAAVALAACGKKEEAPVVEPAPVVVVPMAPVMVEPAAPAASDAMAPASAPAGN
jgi:hypothetical protein